MSATSSDQQARDALGQDSEDAYGRLVDRTQTEGERLNIQHGIFKRAFEYHVHPKLATHLHEHAVIADVASGTTIWLADLQAALPKSCSFHAFDLVDDLFPSADHVPANMQLHVHDVTKPFPEKFHGKFDLVHVSLLVCALLRDEQWDQAMANVVQLLKPASSNGEPGGALQWTELNFRQLVIPLRGRAESTVSGVEQLFSSAVFHSKWGNPRYAELPSLFQEAGLKEVGLDMVSTDRNPQDREAFTREMLGATTRAAIKLVKQGAAGDLTVDQAEQLVEHVWADIDSGTYIRADMSTVIGHK